MIKRITFRKNPCRGRLLSIIEFSTITKTLWRRRRCQAIAALSEKIQSGKTFHSRRRKFYSKKAHNIFIAPQSARRAGEPFNIQTGDERSSAKQKWIEMISPRRRKHNWSMRDKIARFLFHAWLESRSRWECCASPPLFIKKFRLGDKLVMVNYNIWEAFKPYDGNNFLSHFSSWQQKKDYVNKFWSEDESWKEMWETARHRMSRTWLHDRASGRLRIFMALVESFKINELFQLKILFIAEWKKGSERHLIVWGVVH